MMAVGLKAIENMARKLSPEDFDALDVVFENLQTENMQQALKHELGLGGINAKALSDKLVEDFAAECPQLAREWGGRAPKKLACVRARWNRMLSNLSSLERDAANSTLNGLSEAQLSAFFRALATG
jgi:hypothetical protein